MEPVNINAADVQARRDARIMIYHLVTEREFRAGILETVYRPSGLAEDRFVHCALEPSVIPVANDHLAEVTEPVLLLAIDPEKLSSETRYESAAPIEGGGRSHLSSATVFPHVYGPIDCSAITGVGVLRRSGDGYAWPEEFVELNAFL